MTTTAATTEAQQPPSFPALISPDALSRVLGVSRHDLYRDVRTHRRPFVKLGHHVRFHLADVAPELHHRAEGLGYPPARAHVVAARGLLDVEAAAQLLDVHPKWIRRAAAERRLPVVHVGRWVRFRATDLADYVHASTAAPRVTAAGAR